MNIFQRIRDSITKIERFWNEFREFWDWCGHPFDSESGHNKPIQNAPTAIGKEQDTNRENPPNPPSVPPAEHRPENKKYPKETWKDLTKWEKFERVFKVLEGIGIVAGIVVLIFIFKQWKTMQAQTITMQEQWQAMTNQTTIMQGQLEEMRTNRHLDERAWVLATGVINT